MSLWENGQLYVEIQKCSKDERNVTKRLAELSWMVGPWRGQLGDQTVEESWSPVFAESMSTMVRLSSEHSLDMIELIEIRQSDGVLALHLRQFRPSLELYYSGDFEAEFCGEQGVRFVAPGDRIESLSYIKQEETGMRVEVGIMGGIVVSADLGRP